MKRIVSLAAMVGLAALLGGCSIGFGVGVNPGYHGGYGGGYHRAHCDAYRCW